MYAFNATTGETLWTAPTGGSESSPVVAGSVVYIGSGNNFYALDATTGATLWTAIGPPGGDLGELFGPPAAGNGIVYVQRALV